MYPNRRMGSWNKHMTDTKGLRCHYFIKCVFMKSGRNILLKSTMEIRISHLKQWAFRGKRGGKIQTDSNFTGLKLSKTSNIDICTTVQLKWGAMNLNLHSHTYAHTLQLLLIRPSALSGLQILWNPPTKKSQGAEMFNTLKGDSVSHRYLKPGSSGVWNFTAKDRFAVCPRSV
jgi:hypothetical protein